MQNIGWLVTERVFRAGISAFVIAFVARALGPAEFGALNYALLLFGLALPLATLCFDGIVVAELVRAPHAEGVTLGSAFALRVAAGLGTTLLVCGVMWAQAATPDWPTLSAIAVMLVLQSAEVPELWFQRHLLARWTTGARIAALCGGALLKIELARRGAGVPALVWAQAAENGLYTIALFFSYRAAGGRFSTWHCTADTLRRIVRLAWPLGVAGVLVGLYLRMDQLFVQFRLPASEAGVYFAASRLIDVATLAVAAVGTSVFPALAAAHAARSEEFNLHLQAVFDLLSGLGWIVAIGLTLTAPWVVAVLFGPAFHSAVPIVIVKAWTCVLLFSGIARGQFVVLTGATQANLAAVGIGIVVQAVAASSLLPLLGGVGAALAAGCAAVVSGWLSSFLLPSLRPCARPQTRGLLIPFIPRHWASCAKLLS